MDKLFSEWLTDILDKKVWSYADLARKAGVSRGAIGNIIRGERQPGPDILTAIAKALEIDEVTVFRAAGLLPELPSIDQARMEIFLYKFSELPPDRITVEQTVAEVAPLSASNYEPAKALIAGYTGWSCEEYLDWGLRKAEAELRSRPERLHILLIIHDGEPVFRTRTVSDWDLSLAHLRSLDRAGVIPIGVHLGNENLEKLTKLFPRLVNCPNGEALPDRLGSMLSNLA